MLQEEEVRALEIGLEARDRHAFKRRGGRHHADSKRASRYGFARGQGLECLAHASEHACRTIVRATQQQRAGQQRITRGIARAQHETHLAIAGQQHGHIRSVARQCTALAGQVQRSAEAFGQQWAWRPGGGQRRIVHAHDDQPWRWIKRQLQPAQKVEFLGRRLGRDRSRRELSQHQRDRFVRQNRLGIERCRQARKRSELLADGFDRRKRCLAERVLCGLKQRDERMFDAGRPLLERHRSGTERLQRVLHMPPCLGDEPAGQRCTIATPRKRGKRPRWDRVRQIVIDRAGKLGVLGVHRREARDDRRASQHARHRCKGLLSQQQRDVIKQSCRPAGQHGRAPGDVHFNTVIVGRTPQGAGNRLIRRADGARAHVNGRANGERPLLGGPSRDEHTLRVDVDVRLVPIRRIHNAVGFEPPVQGGEHVHLAPCLRQQSSRDVREIGARDQHDGPQAGSGIRRIERMQRWIVQAGTRQERFVALLQLTQGQPSLGRLQRWQLGPGDITAPKPTAREFIGSRRDLVCPLGRVLGLG